MKISAKKYIHREIKWAEKVKDAEISAIRGAVQEFKEVYIQDKASANEFRGQLKDQATTFVSRKELLAAVITIITLMVSIVAILIKFK